MTDCVLALDVRRCHVCRRRADTLFFGPICRRCLDKQVALANSVIDEIIKGETP